MSDSYTVLWNRDRVRIAKQHGLEGRIVEALFGGPHTSQPSFRRAGVQPGDHLYVIAISDGVLHVLLRLTVARIVSAETYITGNPQLFPPEREGAWTMQTLDRHVQDHPEMKALIWTCTEEVAIGQSATPLVLRRPLPGVLLERLRYRSRRSERPVKGVKDGRLTTALSFQGVYRLSEQSAADFEQVLARATVC